MFQYIIKRLALAIPTWLAISVVVFSLSRCASGDVVADKLRNNAESNVSNRLSDALYAETISNLGLDKPTFYMAFLPAAFPDTFHKIVRRDERQALEGLIWQYGNWATISAFHNQISVFLSKIRSNTAHLEGKPLENDMLQLLIQDSDAAITFHLGELKRLSDTTVFRENIAEIDAAYRALKQNPTRYRLYLPRFHWFGTDNQYHQWLSRFLKGDFGLSKEDEKVLDKLKPPLSITFVLSLFSIFLAFLIGVPLGIFVATNRHKRRGLWAMRGIFAIYSLPSFWITMMAALFLTTEYYGFKLFPSIGFDRNTPVGMTIWQSIFWNIGHLILPVLCMTIHPSTIIARQMQGAIGEVLKKEYIRTARAKGLPPHHILWHHALRNALTPLITLLGQMIPAMITGAFTIELIFNLQGIGRTAIDAIFSKDWAVVFAVLMLMSVIILVGNLLVDILYRWNNPRVHF